MQRQPATAPLWRQQEAHLAPGGSAARVEGRPLGGVVDTIRRAHAVHPITALQLGPDVEGTDAIFIQLALAAVMESSRDVAPQLYCRYLAIFLDGTAPSWLILIGSIGIATLAGAAWGFVPGFLKARTGAHEVITTIMLNYIARSLLETGGFRPRLHPRS